MGTELQASRKQGNPTYVSVWIEWSRGRQMCVHESYPENVKHYELVKIFSAHKTWFIKCDSFFFFRLLQYSVKHQKQCRWNLVKIDTTLIANIYQIAMGTFLKTNLLSATKHYLVSLSHHILSFSCHVLITFKSHNLFWLLCKQTDKGISGFHVAMKDFKSVSTLFKNTKTVPKHG